MRVSTDGLVRLTLEELMSLPICHLISGVDADGSCTLASCGTPTTISGFTEWISRTDPVVTLGWDWRLAAKSGTPFWTRLGTPRTNVLLIGSDGEEKTWAQSLVQVGTVVDALPWADMVPKVLSAFPYRVETY